jgi:hypothetical protein
MHNAAADISSSPQTWNSGSVSAMSKQSISQYKHKVPIPVAERYKA